MKNGVLKGTVILLLGGLLSKVLSAFFRLPLANILGSDGIGMFQLIMPFYSFASIFVSKGLENCLSVLISNARADGEKAKVKTLFSFAVSYGLSLSIIVALLFIVFAKSLSSVQGIKNGESAYYLFIFLLPCVSFGAVMKGTLQGFENMLPTAIGGVISQTLKVLLGVFLAWVLISFGLIQSISGIFVALILSLFAEDIYLLFCIKKVFKKENLDFVCNNEQKRELKKEFFKAVLPLTFGSIVLPLVGACEAFVIVPLLSKSGLDKSAGVSLYGLATGVVGAIMSFPSIISSSLGLVILPKITFLHKNNVIEEKRVITKSVCLMWLFLIPLAVGLASISDEVYKLIYPSLVGGNGKILSLLTIFFTFSIIISSLAQEFQYILSSHGQFFKSAFFCLIGGIVKIALLFILVPRSNIGILAVPLSSVFMFLTIVICDLLSLGDLIKLPAFDIILPLLSSCLMVFVVDAILSFKGGILGVILAVLGGGAVYLILCFPLLQQYVNFKKVNFNKIKK